MFQKDNVPLRELAKIFDPTNNICHLKSFRGNSDFTGYKRGWHERYAFDLERLYYLAMESHGFSRVMKLELNPSQEMGYDEFEELDKYLSIADKFKVKMKFHCIECKRGSQQHKRIAYMIFSVKNIELFVCMMT